jgi:hypothetical protein
MIRRRLLVLTSLLLALAVAVPGAAVAKRGGTDRPLKGSGSGTTTGDLATGVATSEGTARFSHAGKTTYSINTTFSATGPNTFALTGTSTLVAANGDSVFSSLTGTATATGIGVGETIEFTLVFTVTGGTGRFADASGTLTAEATSETVSLVGTTFVNRDTFTARGTISY